PFRVVVITGASSGLGASLATAYAAPQVVLGLIGRSRERLEAGAAACTILGAQGCSGTIDVAHAPAMSEWLTDFDRNYPVELLVANAGISAGIEDRGGYESAETTTRQIEVNLLGSVNTIAPLLPGLRARQRGQIALIASVAGLRGL